MNIWKQRILSTIGICTATVIGYIGVELSYRTYLNYAPAFKGDYQVLIFEGSFSGPSHQVSIYGPYPTNKDTHVEYAHVDNSIIQDHMVHFNNYGWISSKDYSLTKEPGEYRIAIVGDSLTACLNNSLPWPDLLEDYLMQDTQLKASLGIKKFTVLNLGVPGNSMNSMALAGSIAQVYSADMIVVNFIIDDFMRTNYKNVNELKEISLDRPNSRSDKVLRISFGKLTVPFFCTSTPKCISNPDCKPSVMWGMGATSKVTEEDIAETKNQLGKMVFFHRLFLSGRLLVLEKVGKILGYENTTRAISHWVDSRFQTFINLITFNYFLHENHEDPVNLEIQNLSSKPKVPINSKEPKEISKDIPLTRDEYVALESLNYIESLNFPKLMITHNILSFHLEEPSRLNPLFTFIPKSEASGLPIIQTDDYLPIQQGSAEWNKWYNLPHDGHWSDYGASVYGKAMALAIHEYFIGPPSEHAESSRLFKDSFELYKKYKMAYSLNKIEEANNYLIQSFESLPKNFKSHYRNTIPYKYGGYIFNLLLDYSSYLYSINHETEAFEYINLAIELNPSHPASYELRAVINMKSGTEDILTLENCYNLIENYDHLLEKDPKNIVYLQKRAKLYQRVGEYQKSINDYSKIIDIMPDHASSYNSRGCIYSEIGQHELANKDTEKFKELTQQSKGWLKITANKVRLFLKKICA